MNLALFLLKHLAVMALIASTALALGLPWIRRLSMTAAERTAVAMAAGLALAGHIALVLGLVGRLEPAVIVAVVVIAHGAAWRDVHETFSRARRAWRTWKHRARWLGVALGILALAPLVLRALYPPMAFDETLYHLPYAREFARTQSLPFLPDLRFPIFPQLVEALFAAVLQLAGDVATHGVSVVATLVTALLVSVWAGRAPGIGVIAGGLAAAIWLGQPVGLHLATSAHVEPALALFGVAATYAAHRWRGDGHRGWLVLAGALAGTAASTKYLGLLVVGGVAIEIAVVAARRSGVRDLLPYGAVVAAAMVVSYGRLLFYTANPVFPFAPSVFGFTPWDTSEMVRPLGVEHGVALVRLPWDIVFDRAVVGGLPPFHPLLTLGLPVMLVVGWWNRQVRAWGLWVVVFVLLAPIGAHYLWTVMPFIALALGVSGAEGLGRVRRAGARIKGAGPLATLLAIVSRPYAWLIVCILPGWLYGSYELARLGWMPTDGVARAVFLAAQRPLFAAVNFVNDQCGPGCTVYAVHAEHMVYFASGRFLGDWNGPASFARTLAGGDRAILLENLRRLGVNRLLVPVAARGETGLFGVDAPGFRHVYGDAAADVYAVSPEEASDGAARGDETAS